MGAFFQRAPRIGLLLLGRSAKRDAQFGRHCGQRTMIADAEQPFPRMAAMREDRHKMAKF